MIKRLFFLSGIIAFLLTCAVMWLWYAPMQESSEKQNQIEAIPIDTLSAIRSDTLHQ